MTDYFFINPILFEANQSFKKILWIQKAGWQCSFITLKYKIQGVLKKLKLVCDTWFRHPELGSHILLPLDSSSSRLCSCTSDNLWQIMELIVTGHKLAKPLMTFNTIWKEKDRTQWIFSMERLLSKTMDCMWPGTLPYACTMHTFSCPFSPINSYCEDSLTSKPSVSPTAPYTKKYFKYLHYLADEQAVYLTTTTESFLLYVSAQSNRF